MAKKKKKGVTAPSPAAPVTPKKHEKPDPKIRRTIINKLQAVNLNARLQALQEAQKLDEGTIKAQINLNSYFTALLHGAGEAKDASLLGVEKGTGSKHVLVYRFV